MELPFERIEYQWQELDEKGNDTGSEIVYDEKIPTPENCRLMLLTTRGDELTDNDVYATIDDIDKIYEDIERDKNI